jgi:peptidoglycan biosynthesis protein MviN/MurJ (putative lipid II flippase)
MSAAMMFLLLFAAAWLAVAVTTVIRLRRGMRRDISLVARAGLLILFTGVIVASLAGARHWPAREIGQVNAVEHVCKVAGFALLAAGLALRARPARSRRTPRAGSRTMSGVMQAPDGQ